MTEIKIDRALVFTLAVVLAWSLSVTCGWAGVRRSRVELHRECSDRHVCGWKDAFRAERQKLPFRGGECLLYARLAQKLWKEDGSPGVGRIVIVDNPGYGRSRWPKHALFVVDEPDDRKRRRKHWDNLRRWCVSERSLEEIESEIPVERGWYYDFGTDIGIADIQLSGQ